MPEEAASRAPQSLERKLSTILSADVAGYSRLMSEDEEGTLRIFRGHKEVFEALIAMHKGRIFNTAGDAILAEFGSAVEAVRCATEIQAALQTRNSQYRPERQVRFRIGVNLGDVMVQGQDLLGDGVNLAARLQTAAEPGGICVSGSVYDQIRNKLSLSFTPMGERNYKNIPQPVRTFSITECEDHSALPVPRKAARGSAGWVVAAVALIVIAAGAFWAYSRIERSKPAAARNQAELPAPPQATPAEEHARPVANTASPAPVTSEPKSSTAHLAPAPVVKKDASAKARAAANVAVSTQRLSRDGVYSGKMCIGAGPNFEASCFEAQATLANGNLEGHWRRAPGLTMFLDGQVSPSGDVQIHLHNEKEGSVARGGADLIGKLHDGRLDASGEFRNGRKAAINWHKESGSPPGSSASH